MSNQYDVLVIGSGPGGYVAAIRAAQLGLKVAIVEDKHVGGICLNWGCIPTKSFLKSAELYTYLKKIDKYGISVDNISFDMESIFNRSREVSKKLTSGVMSLLKKNKITLINGYAKIIDNSTVSVISKESGESKVKANKIIIATGASPKEIKGFEVNHKTIWNYKDALSATKVPGKMVVVGSGAIGVEFASFFSTFGCDVTLVEASDVIAPNEDSDISKILHSQLTKHGIKVMSNASMTKLINNANKSATIEVKDNKTNKSSSMEVDVVLLALGVTPNTNNINLEKIGIKLEKNGTIPVNEYMETNAKGVYAIGDIVHGPWLAHKASHEGIIAAEHIGKYKNVHPMNYNIIPSCTYSIPQMASVGVSEAKAKITCKNVKVGKFPFMANGKAISMGDESGMIKVIFDGDTGEMLGAHMIGSDVTELIQGYAIAMGLETTHQELINTIFPHPSLSEMMHESVLAAFDRAIHI